MIDLGRLFKDPSFLLKFIELVSRKEKNLRSVVASRFVKEKKCTQSTLPLQCFFQILCIVGTVFVATELDVLYGTTYDFYNLVVICTIGYLLILACYLIAVIIDKDVQKIFLLLLLVVGGILNIVAGIVCFIRHSDTKGWANHRGGSGTYLALGMTTLVCGILMLVDVILIMIKK